MAKTELTKAEKRRLSQQRYAQTPKGKAAKKRSNDKFQQKLRMARELMEYIKEGKIKVAAESGIMPLIARSA